LKIAHAEDKNWRKEIQKFLLMYRSTPHSVTGVTLAKLLFKRKLRTKLPEIEQEENLDEEVREKDAWEKLKGKDYYDRRNRVKESDLDIDDKVLVRGEKKNKFSTEFNSERCEIMKRKENTVTVKSKKGKLYKRNLTQVKRSIDMDSEEEPKAEGEENQSTQEEKENLEVGKGKDRPKRNRKVPE